MQASFPKIPVAVVGATGMVGQRFLQLLHDHAWFQVAALAASARSAGKIYSEVMQNRWLDTKEIPSSIGNLQVLDANTSMEQIASIARIVFCAVDLSKEEVRQLEERYAAAGLFVVSNNSAHRWTTDVPMLIPELNPDHCQIIEVQRKKRGWTTGGIAVKPNCSIQSYVPVLHCWRKFQPIDVRVTTMQAVSGAGKTLEAWPEMNDNVIPWISGEEEKSEREPLKIWGTLNADGIATAEAPRIHATCIRVPVSDGHLASVSVRFASDVTSEALLQAVREFTNPLTAMDLPSAPRELFRIFAEPDRPQTKMDRNFAAGMGVCLGRFRQEDSQTVSFVGLSHNTLRGAAGGAVLMAELLVARGLIQR